MYVPNISLYRPLLKARTSSKLLFYKHLYSFDGPAFKALPPTTTMGSQLYYLFCSSSSSSSSLEDSTFEWAFCCQSKFNGSICQNCQSNWRFSTLDFRLNRTNERHDLQALYCSGSMEQYESHTGDSSECRVVCQFDQKNGWSIFLLSIETAALTCMLRLLLKCAAQVTAAMQKFGDHSNTFEWQPALGLLKVQKVKNLTTCSTWCPWCGRRKSSHWDATQSLPSILYIRFFHSSLWIIPSTYLGCHNTPSLWTYSINFCEEYMSSSDCSKI